MSRALYKKLADDFLTKLGNGDIKVGERLPPEENYAEQLGVSRSTLRLAFTQLERSGIIKRKKRGGTEVISDKPVKRYNMVGGGLYDILSLGRDTFMIISDIESVVGEEVEHLAKHLEVSDRWLSIRTGRFMPDEQTPFALTHIFVPEKFSDIQLQAGDVCEMLFRKIEDRYDISVGQVKQSVSAALCSKAEAERLGMKEGDPILVIILEMANTEGQLIEVACSCFDPSRVNINSDIQIGI